MTAGGTVTGAPGEPAGYRLYTDLAAWWPLISPPGEYAAEAGYLRAVLHTAAVPVREVLDLGSGGGNMACHLGRWFRLTLVDLSPGMLAVSRRLNPGCEHHQGDMRTVRLGRTFDAVLVHDAADYLTTRDDLRQVIGTAWDHLRPGGLALFAPDYTAESFRPGRGGGGSTAPDGRQGSFREWRSDADPGDEVIEMRYEFTLRAADGTTQVIREEHRLGAFRRATWRRLLRAAGFEVDEGRPGLVPGPVPVPGPGLVPGPGAGAGEGEERPANLFLGRRPGRAG